MESHRQSEHQATLKGRGSDAVDGHAFHYVVEHDCHSAHYSDMGQVTFLALLFAFMFRNESIEKLKDHYSKNHSNGGPDIAGAFSLLQDFRHQIQEGYSYHGSKGKGCNELLDSFHSLGKPGKEHSQSKHQ